MKNQKVNMRNQWGQRIEAVMDGIDALASSFSQSSKQPFCDPVHIAANSQGQLTSEQIQVLVKEKASHMRRGGCGLLCLSLFIIMPLLIFLSMKINHFALFFWFYFYLLLILLGLACVLIYVGFARRRHFREDLAAGKIVLSVVRLQGEVVWDQKRKTYSAHLPNSLSRPLHNCFPGPYAFYFVEEEARIVSMKPLHTPTQKKQAMQAVQMALCQTLKFDLFELDMNRKGLLSERQRRRCRWVFHKWFLTIRSLEGKIHKRVTVIPGRYNPSTFTYSPDQTLYKYEIEGYSFLVSSTAFAALVGEMR